MTAMIICKGCVNMVREVRKWSGGAFYDTAIILCKGGAKTARGWENGRGVHYMT